MDSGTGTPGVSPRPGGAPTVEGWRLLVWVVLAAAVAFVGISVLRIVQLSHDHTLLAGLHSSPDSGSGFALTGGERLAANWYQWLWWAFLCLTVVWLLQVAAAARSYGKAGRAAPGHWSGNLVAVTVAAALVAFIAFRDTVPTDPDSSSAALDAYLHNAIVLIVHTVVRLAVVGAVAVAVWVRYTRMRALTATAGGPVAVAEA